MRREREAEDVEPPRQPLPRFGVALFDQSRDSGWACAFGGDPFRFPSPADLANDCIWVCGCERSEYMDRWRRLHHLRSAEYISKLSYLAEDLGIRQDGQGHFGEMAKRACAQLAQVLHRSAVIAAQVYDWHSPAQSMREESLMLDIRKTLSSRSAIPSTKAFFRPAMAAAFQTYSTTGAGRYGNLYVSLRLNRLTHAINVMQVQVPDSGWFFHSAEDTPGFRFSLDEALDPQRPCIVNATVEFAGCDPDIANLCAFGSQPGKRSVLRTSISQPELAWLSQFANIQVTAVAYTEGAYPLPASVRLPGILVSDPLYQLSIPAGLVAEAHWRALASDSFSPSAIDKREISPWAVWLRAQDRALCFAAALRAHKSGFRVNSYGNGSLIVCLERDRLATELPRLLDYCLEADIAHPCFDPIFREYGLIE